MSKSLLYHAYGIRDFEYKNMQFKEGKVIFGIKRHSDHLKCPRCGSDKVLRRGVVNRTFRTLPIGRKPTLVEVAIQRVQCTECGCVRQEKLSFADPKKSYTHSLERYVVELSKMMTIQDIALHLAMSWNTIKDIQKRYLKKHFSKPNLKNLSLLAIDEISIGKGHKYLTLVLDLQSGAIVFVSKGKGVNSLEPFWKKLKRAGAVIRAIAIDMSPAYIDAVQTNLPDTTIVFDHFHVIKYFNEKLSNFRRLLYHKISDVYQKNVLKGIRWLILKNPENLNKSKSEPYRLKRALKINKPLATAYYLKEKLRFLWTLANKTQAAVFLQHWIIEATSSGIPMLIKFAKTLASHRSGILAYYDYRISTGPLEGVNNKIKTMKRQAYGYRDMEFFQLKLFALHLKKYALIG